MFVENAFQRFVSSCQVGSHHVLFTVTDSKGKDTELSFNRDKQEWFCACEGFSVRKTCGHVDTGKKYVQEHTVIVSWES